MKPTKKKIERAHKFHDFDFDAFQESMRSESERACAVLGASLLEAKLGDLFERTLRCFHHELLDGSRPLSTFSARIHLSRALDLIEDDARSDLDTIRDIRNKFAHSFDHRLSFGDQSVADQCASLRTAQAFIDGLNLAAPANPRFNFNALQSAFKPGRARYQLAVTLLSEYLDQIKADIEVHGSKGLLAEVRSRSAKLRIH